MCAGAALAAGFLWQTDVPGALRLPAVDVERTFGPGAAAGAGDYARVARALWLGATAAGPRLAARLRGRDAARAVALLALVLAATWLVRLPFGAAAHWWRRRHGLSDQAYPAWLVDPWLELLAGAAAAAVLLLAGMLLARRLGPRWWVAGGPLLALAGAAVVLAQPLVLEPRLGPLADEGLAAEIRAVGDRLGVDVGEVRVKEARRRTTRINAEVFGFGPTRTVVLWDTLLDGRAPREEIRFVAAHELAHVARRHVWKGLGWFALLATPIAWVVAVSTRRRGGLAEPAAVPVAVLAVVAVQLALLPGVNLLTRRYEAEADWVALRATGDPEAAEGLYRRFVRANLVQPRPPAWASVLLSTHPSPAERVAAARAFAALSRPGREALPAGSGSPRGSSTSTTRRPSRP